MQSQPTAPAQAIRLDSRTLVAAALCVLSLFFDTLGWVAAITGIVLLRRAALNRTAKLLLAAVAIAPKILFVAVRHLNAPAGLSFPIESRNLATSPSLWAWCILLAAFGLYLVFLPRSANGPVVRRPPLFLPIACGLVSIGIAAVLLLGVVDGFHRIDDAGQGRWALHHAARGNVAEFSASELASIKAEERHQSRSGRSYTVRVALTDGRFFSVTTKSSAALEELRKFATTANLPEGKVRIFRRNGVVWTNGASGLTLKDCVGTYESADGRSHSTYEFWLERQRLAGKETIAGPEGRHVRVIRNIKLSDTGEAEFEPGTYIDAAQQDKGLVSFSFRWSPQGETGRFAKGGFETGLQSYRKR